MIQISKNRHIKEKRIYNQYIIYAVITGALSVPFILPAKSKLPKKPAVETQKIIINQAPDFIFSAPIETIAGRLTPINDSEDENNVSARLAAPTKIVVTTKPEIVTSVTTQVQKSAIKTHTKAKSLMTVFIENTQIDSNFINKMEGVALKGYVPLPNTTKSGVTIGSGFDLGQMHLREFNQLPISTALKAKLRPYVGLQRLQAVAFLKTHPLVINTSELQELNQTADNKILLPLIKNYDQASKVAFVNLPPQAQTALFSFAYQYGPDFMKKSSTRQLWNGYVQQNWSKVNQTLRNFRMYSLRRQQEANLISKLV